MCRAAYFKYYLSVEVGGSARYNNDNASVVRFRIYRRVNRMPYRAKKVT